MEFAGPGRFFWNLESGIWNLESGIWNLESGIWNLESGIWNLESGIWNLEFREKKPHLVRDVAGGLKLSPRNPATA